MATYRVLCNVCAAPPKRVGERKTMKGALRVQSRHRSTVPHRAALRRYDDASVRVLSPV